jgi:hypothetical protein
MEKEQIEDLIIENESLKRQVIDYSVIIKLLEKEKVFLTEDEREYLNEHLKSNLKITERKLCFNEIQIEKTKRKTKNNHNLSNTVIPNQIKSIKIMKQILEKLDSITNNYLNQK